MGRAGSVVLTRFGEHIEKTIFVQTTEVSYAKTKNLPPRIQDEEVGEPGVSLMNGMRRSRARRRTVSSPHPRR